MNLPCKVIEDLLPLYHDGVCSEESKNLVEEHIATCAHCKDVLHSLKEETAPDRVDASTALGAFQNALKRVQWAALRKGAVITALICVVLVAAFWGLTQWYCIAMPADEMQVGVVAQLQNGRIYYEIGGKDRDFGGWYERTLLEDGVLYLTPKRPVILLHPEWSEMAGEINPDNIMGYRGIEDGTKIQAFYVGTPEDAILIWERGMDLPLADLETIYGNG